MNISAEKVPNQLETSLTIEVTTVDDFETFLRYYEHPSSSKRTMKPTAIEDSLINVKFWSLLDTKTELYAQAVERMGKFPFNHLLKHLNYPADTTLNFCSIKAKVQKIKTKSSMLKEWTLRPLRRLCKESKK